MKSLDEINKKKCSLVIEYTNLWATGKEKTEECNIIIKQIEIIDWILETKYMTIK